MSRSRAGRASRRLPRPRVRRPIAVVQTPKPSARRVTFLRTGLGEAPVPRKRASGYAPHRSRCCPAAVSAGLRVQAPPCGRRAGAQGRLPGTRGPMAWRPGLAPPRPAPGAGRSGRIPCPSSASLRPSCFFSPLGPPRLGLLKCTLPSNNFFYCADKECSSYFLTTVR